MFAHFVLFYETDEDSPNIEERIDELEKVLLRDLKIMKHRQVIHPVLQAGKVLCGEKNMVLLKIGVVSRQFL